jgi:hypothetical protein
MPAGSAALDLVRAHALEHRDATHPGWCIASGEVGGYLPPLGLHTNAGWDKLGYADRSIIRHGFQAKDWFDPCGVWQRDYALPGRVGYIRLLCELTIAGAAPTPSRVRLDGARLEFADATMTSRWTCAGVAVAVTAFASWAQPRLVRFRIVLRNDGASAVPIGVAWTPSTHDVPHGVGGGGRLSLRRDRDGALIGGIDAHYAVWRVVCCGERVQADLAPGETRAVEAAFVLTDAAGTADGVALAHASLAAGFAAAQEEHLRVVHAFWQQARLTLSDTAMQAAVIQGLYAAGGHIGGRELPGAGLLGSGGWSGATYAWDSLHTFLPLLRFGHGARLRPAQDKLLGDLAASARPFINFAWDQRCDGGCGRYDDERHETAAGIAQMWAMLHAADLAGDDAWRARHVIPQLMRLARSLRDGLERDGEVWRKPPTYTDAAGQHIILRSVESDRRPAWYSDLAFALRWIFAEAAASGGADAAESTALRALADAIDVPRAGDHYSFWRGDGFPDVPWNGWGKKRWNHHPALVGAWPFGVGLGDAAVARSLMFPPRQPPENADLHGGYPLVQCLAAARLGLGAGLAELLDRTGAWCGLGGKLDVARHVSISDNDSFLMSYTMWPLIAAEAALGVHDGRVALLPALPPAWRDGVLAFAGLPITGGGTARLDYRDGRAAVELLPGRDGPLTITAPPWLRFAAGGAQAERDPAGDAGEGRPWALTVNATRGEMIALTLTR